MAVLSRRQKRAQRNSKRKQPTKRCGVCLFRSHGRCPKKSKPGKPLFVAPKLMEACELFEKKAKMAPE